MASPGSADLYGVVGHPVAHSQSPRIHSLFARQTGEDLEYVAIDVAPGEFDEQVLRFHETGGRGLNITLPYKQDAFSYADRVTGRARTAGVVNTLAWQDDGSVIGDNTDGAGLVADLTKNMGIGLSGARILILGAGGAARGVLAPLLAESPDEVVIANRDFQKAERLAENFSTILRTQACGYEQIEGSFDLIINATSASIVGEVPPLPVSAVRPDSLCYDMMYMKGPTSFLRWAGEQGVGRLADGTGMLVEQAAESFYLWRQVRPDTAPVLEWLRGFLAADA
jgi:shikimate dehydrogenase